MTSDTYHQYKYIAHVRCLTGLKLENYYLFTFLLFLDLKFENYYLFTFYFFSTWSWKVIELFTFLLFLDLKLENHYLFTFLLILRPSQRNDKESSNMPRIDILESLQYI